MSVSLSEAALRSARVEMVQWAADNYGAAVSRRLQASLVPRVLHTTPWLLIKSRPRYNRFSSTLPSHPPTLDTSPTAPNTLRAILEKSSKSKLDIEALRSLLGNPTTTASSQPHDRHEALILLLRFKKYDWVYALLEGDVRDQRETAIFLETLALLKRHDEIAVMLQPMDTKSRDKLLHVAVHELTETISRSKTALHLWITAASVSHPSLKVVHKPNSKGLASILLTILNKINDPRDVIEHASPLLNTEEQQSNFIHNLSYAYYMLSRPEDIVKTWEATAQPLRTSSMLSNTIQAYTSLKKYSSAIDIFFQNKSLWNVKMKGDLIAAATALKYKGNAKSLLRLLVQEGIIGGLKITRVLKTLLDQDRLQEFDTITQLYLARPSTHMPIFYNVLMERHLRSSDTTLFYEQLRAIYDEESNPTTRTFRLLFDQFAKLGQIDDALSLLEVLIQRKKQVNIHNFTSLVQTCERTQSAKHLGKVVNMMKKLKIEPDENFERALLSLHYTMKDYDEVQRLFPRSAAFQNDTKSLVILMKTHLMKKHFSQARLVLHKILTLKRANKNDVNLAKLEFYVFQGNFLNALKIFGQMQARGVQLEPKHYRVLMKGYNKFQKYDDAVTVFRMAMENGQSVDSGLYREFVVSMVKSGVLNRTNLQDPTTAVDQILNRYRSNELPIQGKLKFKSIKPLVKMLVKKYDSQEAFRLMQEYSQVDDTFDMNNNLNFMKQEMVLYSSQKKWTSFEIVYQNFQERIKEFLVEDGEAPLKLKKIYNSVLSSIYRYYVVKKDFKGFSRLFEDLIFVHGFTFDSNRMNWITRQMMRRRSTFHDGLQMVEKKLIGGRIAKALVRVEKTQKRRLGQRVVPHTYKGMVLKPHLALGYINQHELCCVLYTRILNSSRRHKKDIHTVVSHYTKLYPKTMSTLAELKSRLDRKLKIEKEKKLQKLELEKAKKTGDQHVLN